MKRSFLFAASLFVLISCSKKPAAEPPLLIDQLSNAQLQILDAAPTDTTTSFSDILFPDGSNISDWDSVNDSGYVYSFTRVTSILSASDKKQLFIDRMTKAGLILTDDTKCSCFPGQPNGLAYVFGSKEINAQHVDPSSICRQSLWGLDCSGMIYQMAKGSSLNLISSGTRDYIKPSVWNSAFNSSPDFQGLEMKDLSTLPASQLQAGDLIVVADHHIGMVYSTGNALGIMNSQGSYLYTCSENSQAGRGPVLKSNVQSWLTILFPNNDYHVLRVALNGSPGLNTKPISAITQSSAMSGGNITNEGGSSVIARGVCWDISSNPTIANQKTANGTGIGSFTSILTGLIPNTKYYVRAYASNSLGTSYGNQISFITSPFTFKDVLSPSGRTWMDRNLGASQVATSSTDYLSYGYLYQWGRGSDGHQLINWANANGPTAFYGTTTTLSGTNDPGHNLFIISSIPQFYVDWRNPQNPNLWQGGNGINNPCPAGYRLPTTQEFLNEVQFFTANNTNGAFQSVLKLPLTPVRHEKSGSITADGYGRYWTSTTNNLGSDNIQISSSSILAGAQHRGTGICIRCIKN